jgi:hypothetical protein
MTPGPLSAHDNALPDEVTRLLTDPATAGVRAIHHLLTVDDQGRPHATLSSASQWWTGPGRVVCVLDAGRTARYLSRRPQALLLVVGALHAYSVRLLSSTIKEVADGQVAVVFDVVSVEHDSRGVALTPMSFEATDELTGRERISRDAIAVAAQLARGRETRQ